MRATDRQDQPAPGTQQLCHPGQGGLRVGQMFQQMRSGDKVEAARWQVGAVQVPRDQNRPSRPQPLVGGAQHGGRRVKQCQPQARTKPGQQRLGKGTIARAEVQRMDRPRTGQSAGPRAGQSAGPRARQIDQRLPDNRPIGGGKAQPCQPPPPVRGGGLVTRGQVAGHGPIGSIFVTVPASRPVGSI